MTWTSQRPCSYPDSWSCRDLKLQRPAQQNCALLACDLARWTGVIFSSILRWVKVSTRRARNTKHSRRGRFALLESRRAWICSPEKKGKITPVLQANCNHISLSIICMSIVKKKKWSIHGAVEDHLFHVSWEVRRILRGAVMRLCFQKSPLSCRFTSTQLEP